jgi:flagellar motor component MotA
LLILKFAYANIGILLGLGLEIADALATFVLGGSIAQILMSTLQPVIVFGLIWIAFRHMLGKDSGVVKALERGFSSALKTFSRAVISLLRSFFRWVIDASKPKGRVEKS